jgi:hypothetical protein
MTTESADLDVLDLARRREAASQREAKLWRHAVSAHQRLSFLSEASQELSGSLNVGKVVDTLTRLAVPRVADWCAVHLIGADERNDLIGVRDVEPRRALLLRELHRRFPADPKRHPLFISARTGLPQYVGHVRDSWLRKIAQSQEHLRLMRELR